MNCEHDLDKSSDGEGGGPGVLVIHIRLMILELIKETAKSLGIIVLLIYLFSRTVPRYRNISSSTDWVKELSFCHKLKFSSFLSLQPDSVNLS